VDVGFGITVGLAEAIGVGPAVGVGLHATDPSATAATSADTTAARADGEFIDRGAPSARLGGVMGLRVRSVLVSG
jgi:hypothetical protein